MCVRGYVCMYKHTHAMVHALLSVLESNSDHQALFHFRFFFYFVGIGLHFACTYFLCATCMQCPQTPEGGERPSGIAFTDGYELPGRRGIEPIEQLVLSVSLAL